MQLNAIDICLMTIRVRSRLLLQISSTFRHGQGDSDEETPWQLTRGFTRAAWLEIGQIELGGDMFVGMRARVY